MCLFEGTIEKLFAHPSLILILYFDIIDVNVIIGITLRVCSEYLGLHMHNQ